MTWRATWVMAAGLSLLFGCSSTKPYRGALKLTEEQATGLAGEGRYEDAAQAWERFLKRVASAGDGDDLVETRKLTAQRIQRYRALAELSEALDREPCSGGPGFLRKLLDPALDRQLQASAPEVLSAYHRLLGGCPAFRSFVGALLPAKLDVQFGEGMTRGFQQAHFLKALERNARTLGLVLTTPTAPTILQIRVKVVEEMMDPTGSGRGKSYWMTIEGAVLDASGAEKLTAAAWASGDGAGLDQATPALVDMGTSYWLDALVEQLLSSWARPPSDPTPPDSP